MKGNASSQHMIPNALGLGVGELSVRVVGEASFGERRGPAAVDRSFLISKSTRSI
jgi:hypothetical protein